MVLAVIVGIGTGLFSEFTTGYAGGEPTIEQALSVALDVRARVEAHDKWPHSGRWAALAGGPRDQPLRLIAAAPRYLTGDARHLL